MNLNEYLKDKKVGFWFSVATSFLLILSGILVLTLLPANDSFMHFATMNVSNSFITIIGVLFIVGGLTGAGLIALKLYKAIGFTLFGFILIGFLLFAFASYQYIFEMIVGIEINFSQISGSFVFLVVLLLITLGLSVADIFLKQNSTSLEEVNHE